MALLLGVTIYQSEKALSNESQSHPQRQGLTFRQKIFKILKSCLENPIFRKLLQTRQIEHLCNLGHIWDDFTNAYQT